MSHREDVHDVQGNREGISSPLMFLRGAGLVLILWIGFSLVVPRIVPPPWNVVVRAVHLLPDPLLIHLAVSLIRVGTAMIVAFGTAVPLGILMGRNRTVDRILSPAVYLLYPVPKIAFLPVAILIAGLGNVSKAGIVAVVLFFQVLVAVRDGVNSTPAQYVTAVRSLGAGRLGILRFVILPAVLPRLFTAFRIGSATALSVLFFAETFSSNYGLGHFILDSWIRVAYTDMYAGILTLGLTGYGLFILADLGERLACPWLRTEKDRPSTWKAVSAE